MQKKKPQINNFKNKIKETFRQEIPNFLGHHTLPWGFLPSLEQGYFQGIY
jgi:hypothetical protein